MSAILIIGSTDCPLKEILQIILNNENPERVSTLWWAAASLLETPVEIKMKIQRKIEEYMTLEALQMLLIDWRSRVAENAKLLALIDILEKVGLGNCASELRLRFSTEANDNKPIDSLVSNKETEEPIPHHITQGNRASIENTCIQATETRVNISEEERSHSNKENKDEEGSYGLCSNVQIINKLCFRKTALIILIWLMLLIVFFGVLIYFFTMPRHQFTLRNNTSRGSDSKSKCIPYSLLESWSNEDYYQDSSVEVDCYNAADVDTLNTTISIIV